MNCELVPSVLVGREVGTAYWAILPFSHARAQLVPAATIPAVAAAGRRAR